MAIKKMYNIEIIDNTFVEETRSPDPGDSWDRGNTHTSHSIEGFKVVGEKNYSDLVVTFEPHTNVEYYLLYAVYSTGDSFGNDSGRGIEYFGLYTKDQLVIAQKNMLIIQSAEGSSIDIFDFNKEGNKMTVYCPWNGYFESLDYVTIKPVYML